MINLKGETFQGVTLELCKLYSPCKLKTKNLCSFKLYGMWDGRVKGEHGQALRAYLNPSPEMLPIQKVLTVLGVYCSHTHLSRSVSFPAFVQV